MSDKFDKVRAAFDGAEDIAPDDSLTPPADPPNDGPPPPEEPDAPDKFEIGAAYPLNDTGNGRRFALYFGDDAMFVPRVGWHVWDMRRWKIDPDGIKVRRLAQDVHELIEKEIPHLKLKRAEREAVDRLQVIANELRLLNDNPNDLPQDDIASLRGPLLSEKTKLNGKLWGRSSTRQRHLTHAKSAGNTSSLTHMLTESTTTLAREIEDLDADPLTVNTMTGILRFQRLDLREEGASVQATVGLEPHAREAQITGRNCPQYITKMVPVDYDPEATCPEFDAFLARVQPDPDMRAFLQRWFGLSMSAEPIQKFLYCYGVGANGKSLLANLMRRMLGDYATMVKIESLTGKTRKSGSDATPDLMRLIGARAAITNEPEEGEQLQEQKVKEMTGGDEMLVRNLHSDFVAFTPHFKLTFTGNHKLEIRGTDDGIWRRPLLCPFDVQIPEAERDLKLGDRLFDNERSGILNWLIAGLIDYLEGGLQEPDQVLEATEEYRKDSDPVGDFLATCCVIEGGTDWTSARDVIDACYLHSLENQAYAWRAGTLSRKIKERAGKYHHPATGKTFLRHKRGVWGYHGLRLSDDMRTKLNSAMRDSKGLPMLPRDDGGST